MASSEPKTKRSLFQILQLVFLGIIAFSTSAILVWMILPHPRGVASGSAPDTLPPASSFAGTGKDVQDSGTSGSPQSIQEHQFAQEPDVSQMPPAQAAVALGNWSFDNKLWSQAIKEYEKAISLGLDNADIRTDLGTSYRFSGRDDQALNEYKIAHQLDPQHQNSLFNLATLYLENLNQPAKAVELLEDFAKRFPHSDALPKARELLERAKRQAGSLAPVPGGPKSP